MFIFIVYKDAPELSYIRRRSSETDVSVEKTLLVNPTCPVRIMLEYIRKRLALFTAFDICDESGALMGLFNLPTYVYATDRFEHKKTYYLVVIRQDSDKRASVLPQLNRDNKLYLELKSRVKWFLANGESPMTNSPPANPGKVTPPGPIKVTPPKAPAKKK